MKKEMQTVDVAALYERRHTFSSFKSFSSFHKLPRLKSASICEICGKKSYEN